VLNALLAKAALTHRFGIFALKESFELERTLQEIDLPIIALHIDKNGAPNVEGIDYSIIEEMHTLILKNKGKRKSLVANQQYERAAQLRDRERQSFVDMYEKVNQELKLNEGFNYYKGKLLIVKSEDVNQRKAMTNVLQKFNISVDRY
jgi:hypothetical protein